MGNRSAEMLLCLLEDPTCVQEPARVQGRLIVRESCGSEEGQMPMEKYRSHTTPPELLSGGKKPS